MNGLAKSTDRFQQKGQCMETASKTKPRSPPVAGSTSAVENGDTNSLPAYPSWKFSNPEEMLTRMNEEIKELKLEVKKLFVELEDGKKELGKTMKEVKEVRKKEQVKKLKGNELVKLDHLFHLGFEEDIIQDHLEKEIKKVEKELKTRQKDVKNVEGNIEKMVQMNQQCEQAVTAALGAYNHLVVNHQTLRSSLDAAELELYAAESKVKHKRNMKSVEITSKDGFKHGLKDVVREVKSRCDDDDLVRDVLKIAGKCLSTDIDLPDEDDSSCSVSVSSASTDCS